MAVSEGLSCVACALALHPNGFCTSKECLLLGVEQVDEHDRMQARELRQQLIVQEAVAAADRVVNRYFDGTNEEHHYLNAELATKFFNRMASEICSILRRKEMQERYEARTKAATEQNAKDHSPR